MPMDPDLRPFLPIMLVVFAGFLLGLTLLAIAVFTGP
jgi:hypothetical protein